MQIEVFKEVSESAPDGLEPVLKSTSARGNIDYYRFVQLVLKRTFGQQKDVLTDTVRDKIDKQADLIIASQSRMEFGGEETFEGHLRDHPVRCKALLWIMLTWCYQRKFAISKDAKDSNHAKSVLISQRAKPLDASEDLSTLRRMLMTPVFSLQWEKPSAERLELHALHISAVRSLVRSKLEETLKGATLAQWVAPLGTGPVRDYYCKLIQHAEVGNFMRDYFRSSLG
jgi:hypothetical protein